MNEQVDLFGALPPESAEERGALFSNCRRYRYALWRIWTREKPQLFFVAQNPSTATEEKDDPTIRSCRRIAEFNEYGGFTMLNLFAYITPYPEEVSECENPVGENDIYLIAFKKQIEETGSRICFAWGNLPYEFMHTRSKVVSEMFAEAFCLGTNKNGTPKHPLYIPANVKLIKYK